MSPLWVSGSPSLGRGAVHNDYGHRVLPHVRGLCLGCQKGWPRTGKPWGAQLSISLGTAPLPEVQSAMDESHILEKMAADAGMKPIKGITK